MGYVLKAFVLAPFARRLAGMYLASPNAEDLLFLKNLIEAGKVRPVVDRAFPLDETPEAVRFLEESHAQGKVVITVIE